MFNTQVLGGAVSVGDGEELFVFPGFGVSDCEGDGSVTGASLVVDDGVVGVVV